MAELVTLSNDKDFAEGLLDGERKKCEKLAKKLASEQKKAMGGLSANGSAAASRDPTPVNPRAAVRQDVVVFSGIAIAVAVAIAIAAAAVEGAVLRRAFLPAGLERERADAVWPPRGCRRRLARLRRRPGRANGGGARGDLERHVHPALRGPGAGPHGGRDAGLGPRPLARRSTRCCGHRADVCQTRFHRLLIEVQYQLTVQTLNFTCPK